MTMQKPPTQGVGVDGFSAFVAVPEQPLRPAIDWAHVSELPAFQMFMADRHPRNEQPPSLALFDEYCQWHTDKGYWPSEDPMGRIK